MRLAAVPTVEHCQRQDGSYALLLSFTVEDGVSVWTVQKTVESVFALHASLQMAYAEAPVLQMASCALLPKRDFIQAIRIAVSLWLQQVSKRSYLLESQYVRHFVAASDQTGRPVEQETTPEPKKHGKMTSKDFIKLKVIGRGSFGKVFLVRKRDSGEVFAMKVLNKVDVLRKNQIEHTMTERAVLEHSCHPFIVSLRYAFQTKSQLYFVLDYCSGGELFFHLEKEKQFAEDRARLYAAQIVLALQHLHELGVVYRDLKNDGYIAITDFGLSKEAISDNVSAHSFCGTPEYLAPEVVLRSGHGQASDWWSLGALVYEMLTGTPPFLSRNRDRLFAKILHADLDVPNTVSAVAHNFLTSLLRRDPSKRLGYSNGASEIKQHAFFSSINWRQLARKKLEMPWKPPKSKTKHKECTRNFDKEFTKLSVKSKPERDQVSENWLDQHATETTFEGFSYIQDIGLLDPL